MFWIDIRKPGSASWIPSQQYESRAMCEKTIEEVLKKSEKVGTDYRIKEVR
jgi:hypothetical protein